MSEHPVSPPDWPRDLRRKIACVLAVKLTALLLLWLVFFRGSYQ